MELLMRGAAHADFAGRYGDLAHQRYVLERAIREEIHRPKDQALILAALSFAEKKHDGQFRDGNGRTPYVIHPIRVCRMLVSEMGVRSPEVLAAALLHDTIEDCGVGEVDLRNEFGWKVSGLVRDLSRKADESKEAYLGNLRDAS